MSITLPGPLPTLAAGQVVDASHLNSMVDAVNFLAAKPLCYLKTTAGGLSISTTPNTTAISWGSALYDNSGMFSSGSPTLVTIQTPGWYKIRYSVLVTPVSGTEPAFNGYISYVGQTNNYLGSYCLSVNTVPVGGLGATGLWPFYLKTGDQLSLQIHASATGQTTSNQLGSSSISFEYVSM